MKRRMFVYSSTAIVSTLILNNSALAIAHKNLQQALPGLGGGGKKGDWKSIVANFSDGLKVMAMGAQDAAEALSLMLEALEIKIEIALSKQSQKNMRDGKPNSQDLADNSTYTEAAVKAINEKTNEQLKLNAEQKQVMADAGDKYFPAVLKGVGGGVIVFRAFNDAKDAGSPNPIALGSSITVAKDIPLLAPKAISFVTNSFEYMKTVRKVYKQIEVPIKDEAKIDDANSAMGGISTG